MEYFVHRNVGETLAHLAAAAAVNATGPAGIWQGQQLVAYLPWTPDQLVTRSEHSDTGRLHRRGDMHGHGIHADKTLRLRRQRRELLEVELAGQIHHRLFQARGDARGVLKLGFAGRGGQHHRLARLLQGGFSSRLSTAPRGFSVRWTMRS